MVVGPQPNPNRMQMSNFDDSVREDDRNKNDGL